MALANPPFMVNGGDTDAQRVYHSAASVRRSNYARGGDQTGITGPDSLQVVAGATPGPFVNVMPGSGVITYAQGRYERQDRAYAEAKGQSVDVYNDALTQVDIEPTTSAGGRTDLICVVLDDPEYEGTRDTTDFPNHEFVRFHVIQGVSNSTEHPYQLNLGYPVLPLAQVRIPRSTATITNSHIHDVRHMAFVKSAYTPLVGEVNTTGDFVDIPPEASQWQTLYTFDDIAVPTWASRAHIEMTLGPMYAVGNTGQVARGQFRVMATGQNASHATLTVAFAEAVSASRVSPVTAGSQIVNWRTAGDTARLELQVRRMAGSSSGSADLRLPGGGTSGMVAKGSITYEQVPRFSTESGL